MKKAILVLLGIITLAGVINTDIDLGVCLNEQGDGLLYNGEPYYNYISYARTSAHTGDMVFTVCFLNPTNFEPDDIVYRTDLVLGRR